MALIRPGSISSTRVFNTGGATLTGLELTVSAALSRRLLATRLQTLDVFGETQPVQAPLTMQSAAAKSALLV